MSPRSANVSSIDRMMYTRQVEEALGQLFDTNVVLQKIRRGEPVTNRDLESLTSLVLTQNPDVDLNLLREFYPESASSLDFVIRMLVGMEPAAVENRFAEFARRHPINAKQTQFLRLLKNHISKYGTVSIERLYEPPFTTVDSNGLDGVFTDENVIDELVSIINTFQMQAGATL